MAKVLVAVMLAATAALPMLARAEEKVELKASTTMREMLGALTGKRVALRVDDGAELDGTLVMVGEQVLQLSKLGGGRDFYDAYVRVDSVRAVIVKAR